MGVSYVLSSTAFNADHILHMLGGEFFFLLSQWSDNSPNNSRSKPREHKDTPPNNYLTEK